MINDLGPDLTVADDAENGRYMAHELPTNSREAIWRDAPRG
jgi:hypothetical protein